MSKLFMFDLDGTLLNTLPTIQHYGNNALEKHGFSGYSQEDYCAFVGDGRDVLIHRMLAAQNADTEENFQNVRDEYDRGYERDTIHLTKPYDNLLETLAELKNRGETLAVLTNKPNNVAQDVVRYFFYKRFDKILGASEGLPTKPNPTGALMMCKELGFEPSRVVYFGDTSVDMQTGKNAGFYTVGVEWGFRKRAELEQNGADCIIKTTPEILNFSK